MGGEHPACRGSERAALGSALTGGPARPCGEHAAAGGQAHPCPQGLGPVPLPCAQPIPVAPVRQGMLEVCLGWGSVLEERREGLGSALKNAAHTSCCKWSIHHRASWLVRCAAVLVPPPDMESCTVFSLKIEEVPKYTP